MPSGSWSLLFSLIVLLILSSFFSSTETAYTSISRTKLKTLSSNGNKRAKKVLFLAEENYDKFLSTILIGNNIVNLTASALSTLFFAKILINSKIDSTFVSTLVVTIAVLIFGEITPKYVAKTYPEKIALAFYPLVISFYYILTPFNFIFSLWRLFISHVFKLENLEKITEDEIMTFVEEAQEDGTLKQDETKLIRSVIEFDDLEVEDILTPRVNLIALDFNSTIEETKSAFNNYSFSRLPIYKDSIDSIIGFIHEKDFYNEILSKDFDEDKFKISNIMQEAYFTTGHTKISKLLKILQKKRIQLAIVLDEYGGTLGIVTIEDILEELVGEIYDEHDEEITFHKEIKEGYFVIDGNAPLDKAFAVLGLSDEKADSFDASTVSGWVIELLGEIPQAAKEFEYEGYKVKVLKATIKKVLQLSFNKIQ